MRTHCWTSTCWNSCCLGNWRAVLGVQQKKRNWTTLWLSQKEWEYLSHMCVPWIITHIHIYVLNLYSIKISPAALHFLESSLIYQKDEHYHIQMQKDIKPHVVCTCLLHIRSLPVGTGERTGERCKSTMIKRKRRKKISTFQSSLPDVGCDFLASHRY